MRLHTLLGSTCAIAHEFVPFLQLHNQKVRLISSIQRSVGGETMVANLLDYYQALKVIEGSEFVNVLVGII